MTSFPDAREQWPEQWERLVSAQGEPIPKRTSKNGKNSEELEKWADNCTSKVAYYLGRASGDGFWECKVNWFEVRALSLREDAAVLRKEVAPVRQRDFRTSPYSVSDRPSILRVSGAIRPLSPPPPPKDGQIEAIERRMRAREREEMISGPGPIPFRPPRKTDVDLSAFLISKTEMEDAKKQLAAALSPPPSPPQSPSDTDFKVILH